MKYSRQSEEDFFTECFAATLKEDPELTKSFLIQICGGEVNGISVSSSSIILKTQEQLSATSCIDMVFHLGGNKLIGIENKLWSPEGEGQLLKYINHPLDRLAYITGYYSNVPAEVVKDPRYLKPQNGRQHFMWSDFYGLIEKSVRELSASILNKALLALFESLGFNPPHPDIGELLHTNPEEIGIENRKNFKKLWNLTRQGLQERGWKKIYPGSIAELYVESGSSKKIESAWLDPMWQRGNLRIRLTPKSTVNPVELLARLESAGLPLKNDLKVIPNQAPRKMRKIQVIEVRIPLNKLFANISDSESLSKRLAQFVWAVFDTAS
jgi:hypothetical protein